MSWRNAEPQHVGESAGPAIGDSAEEPSRLSRQDRLGADSAFEERQPSVVIAGGHSIKHPRIDKAAREPDPDSRTRGYYLVEVSRNQVVEGPVEVR
jgi:hypothetical protein